MPRLKHVALAVSICLVLVTAFQWPLVDTLTPFLMLPLQGFLWLIFIVVAIWSLVHLVRHEKKSRNLFPAVLCVAALGIVTLVPFTKIWLNFNLGSKKSARERIVQQISAGMLTPNRVLANGVGVISLPKLTPNISAGGNEIETATRDGRTYVFFYTYRGILNSYAGFLYVPTGGNPDAYPDLKSDPQAISDRYEEHWYFVSHRN